MSEVASLAPEDAEAAEAGAADDATTKLTVEVPKEEDKDEKIAKAANKKRRKSYDMNALKPEFKPIMPRIEAKPEEYKAMPYIFRIPAVSAVGNVENQATRCPPFHVLLDHTIAVVWSLYTKSNVAKPLGINQLQWALAFLDTIRNEKGKLPPDVAHCIETITDELIEEYAELADDVQFINENQCKELDMTSHIPSPTNEGGGGSGENVDQAEALAKMKKRDAQKPNMMLQQNVPFSINYADMIHRTPSTGAIQVLTATDPTKDPCPEDTQDTQEMMNFLTDWRREQMKKIFMELDRLHTIETYMGSKKNASQYMDQSDKQVQEMLAADKTK